MSTYRASVLDMDLNHNDETHKSFDALIIDCAKIVRTFDAEDLPFELTDAIDGQDWLSHKPLWKISTPDLMREIVTRIVRGSIDI